jgi:uridine kinase
MIEQRQEFLKELAGRIDALKLYHPIRVAIDGVDTSGKTTLANELVEPLKSLGRPVIRASLDGFHNPRKDRYPAGMDLAKSYFLRSFNYPALIQNLLRPLGNNPPGAYQTAVFNHITDKPVSSSPQQASLDSVLVFDGTFLQRPEINQYWDLRIFLQVPFDEVLLRAKVRDRKILGDELEDKYKTRYIPGQKLYLNSVHPEQTADIVVDNTDVNNPKIL